MEPVPLLDLKLQYASLRDEIDRAVAGLSASQRFVLGPVVERFEQAVARFVGSDHAIGCASGPRAHTRSGPDRVLPTSIPSRSTSIPRASPQP
jgi:hypothetical protein